MDRLFLKDFLNICNFTIMKENTAAADRQSLMNLTPNQVFNERLPITKNSTTKQKILSI